MEHVSYPQYQLHMEVYTHGFRVWRFDDRVRIMLIDFCRRYVKTQQSADKEGRYITEIVEVYAAATKRRNQYFFHANLLSEFMDYMDRKGIPAQAIAQSQLPLYQSADASLKWINHDIELRDYQNLILEFLDKEQPRTKLINLQAGRGKTLNLLAYVNHARTRTVLLMRPMYIEQWVSVITECFSIKKGDLYVISGAKALRELILLAKEDVDFHPSLILISNATYRNYLRSFLDNPDDPTIYDCLPWEFFATMRAGLVAVDEVHQDFHFNFIMHCMSNMLKYAAMSGTMVSDIGAVNKIYRIMFPNDTYAPTPEMHKYIDVYDVFYRIDRIDRIRFLARGAYHQSTFEKSIMRFKGILHNYVDMIVKMVEAQVFNHHDYRPGMKALVFCDLVAMCTVVQEALAAKFPQKRITRFCATVDPEENLYGKDIDCIVTTLKSCGTARDIADVSVAISTIGLNGRQASEQLIHRLRVLKRWPDITPRFIFLSSRSIPKHWKYAEDRKEKLKHVVKNFNSLTSTFIV